MGCLGAVPAPVLSHLCASALGGERLGAVEPWQECVVAPVLLGAWLWCRQGWAVWILFLEWTVMPWKAWRRTDTTVTVFPPGESPQDGWLPASWG